LVTPAAAQISSSVVALNPCLKIKEVVA